MLYELIIFTMLAPNVEPKWQHMEPTSQAICIERTIKFEKIFVQTEELVFSFTCKPIKEKESQ